MKDHKRHLDQFFVEKNKFWKDKIMNCPKNCRRLFSKMENMWFNNVNVKNRDGLIFT